MPENTFLMSEAKQSGKYWLKVLLYYMPYNLAQEKGVSEESVRLHALGPTAVFVAIYEG